MSNQIKLIVEYQEIDKNLKVIEDELNGSDIAKKYVVARKFLSTVKEALSELDGKAKSLTDAFNQAVLELEGAIKSAEELGSTVETCQNEEELEYFKKKYQSACEKVNSKQQKLENLSKDMTELYKEYGKLGQQNRVMKAQFDEFAPKLEELKNSKKEEVQKLKTELKKLESEIDKELIEKYLVRRKDKKFPIVFGLDLKKKMNYCPFCATSLSLSFIEDLGLGTVKECESCHRLIYGFESKK